MIEFQAMVVIPYHDTQRFCGKLNGQLLELSIDGIVYGKLPNDTGRWVVPLNLNNATQVKFAKLIIWMYLDVCKDGYQYSQAEFISGRVVKYMMPPDMGIQLWIMVPQ